MTAPSIACIGVIGKLNNPLHIAIFPSYNPMPADGKSFSVPVRTPLQFSLILSSTLDIFEARSLGVHNPTQGQAQKPGTSNSTGNLSGDLGMLMTIDERLNAYGYETNTGVKFIVIVDVRGRKLVDAELDEEGSRHTSGTRKSKGTAVTGSLGVRDADLKIVFRAMQTAYIRLLMNPFFEPDDHNPGLGRTGKRIESKKFASEIKRLGSTWELGITTL